jgi:hypothetical protein
MRGVQRLLGMVLLAAAWQAAPAVELLDASERRVAGVYELRLVARLDAPPSSVRRVLEDYSRLEELHGDLQESTVVGRPDAGVAEVRTRFRGCVAFFCRSVERLERIRATEDGLLAEDVPGAGDFDYGRTAWRIGADGEGTRLVWETRFVPAFWVPRIFGNALLSSMRTMATEMFAAVEERAGES